MEQSVNDTANQQARKMNQVWLAGLWEGEGNISIVVGSKNRFFPRATLINTDFMLIEACATILTENGVGHYIQTRIGGCDNNPLHKDAKVIQIVGAKRMKRFLETFLPYFKGRKLEVGQEVLTYVERRLQLGKGHRYTSDDVNSIKRVRALNKKGSSLAPETTRQPLPELASEDIVQVV